MRNLKKFLVTVVIWFVIAAGVPVAARAQNGAISENLLIAQLAQIVQILKQQVVLLTRQLSTARSERLSVNPTLSQPPSAAASSNYFSVSAQAPNKPTDLVATSVSQTQIALIWQDNASNEIGFYVERSLNGIVFIQVATTSSAFYNDYQVSANTTYWYRVNAYNSTGVSRYSNIASAATPPGVNVPNPPTNLTASSSLTQVALKWQDNSNNEDGFVIQRSGDGFNFSGISTTTPNIASYYDINVISGATYWYRITAFNSLGYSGYSNIVQVVVASLPNPPTNLTATIPSATTTQVILNWQDNANSEFGFFVERSVDGATFSNIATTTQNITVYYDFLIQPNTTYWYRARAFNQNGPSTYSNIAQITIPPAPTIPNPPTNLTASSTSAYNVGLYWQDHSATETGFLIERSLDGTTFTNIASTSANVIFYTDLLVSPGTTYWYRVRAYNTAGYSAYSNVAQVATPPGFGVPNPPSNLTATSSASKPYKAILNWQDNSINESGFVLERSNNGGIQFIVVATTSPNVITYSEFPAAGNYWYRVKSYNPYGYSSYSNIAQVNVGNVPNAPTNLLATAVSASSIFLQWFDNSTNETAFSMERGLTATSMKHVATTSPNNTNIATFTDTGLNPKTTYYYRVRAYNQGGYSNYSNTASAKTY